MIGVITDRIPVKLEPTKVKDVVNDLSDLTHDEVTGLCAAMVVELFPYDWHERFENIKKEIIKNREVKK